jgi:hypothetical protein
MDSLSLLLWNANGILRHRNELEFVLHDRRIDVALISETHLSPNINFYMRGYQVYRCDHPDGTSHAGAAVLVKSSLMHHALPTSPKDYMQAASVVISLQNFDVSVASVYCPPRHRITYQQFGTFFSNLGNRFLAGGDFNSKHPQWGSRIINPRGRTLRQLSMDKVYSFHSPNSPTYWPTARHKLPDLLDFYISKGLNSIPAIVTALPDLSSDHSPVHLLLDVRPAPRIPAPSLTAGLMNWDLFRMKLETNLNNNISLKTAAELENAVEYFTRSVQEAAWTSSTPKRPTHGTQMLFPQHIRDLIQEKRRARHRWQRTRLPVDHAHFNRLANKLKRDIYKVKQERYTSHLSSLSSSNSSLWSEAKRLMKHKQVASPLRLADGTWAKSEAEIAETFMEHLQMVFCPHADVVDTDFCGEVDEFLSSPLLLSLPPTPFTSEEVKRAVLQLPLHKSPGHDLLTAEVLRELPANAFRFITLLFNATLRTSHFPIQWKLSLVVLILKPGKPAHITSSYRPISLLPLMSKLLERLLLPRILFFLEESGTVPTHQFGFRKGHSTIQQLHRVVDYASDCLERKLYCVGVFLDISSAFDRVWHNGLLFKLKHQLPDSYYRLVRSFLEDRFFKVRQGSSLSSLGLIQAGVPQGAILSPTFYNVFTSDIPTCVDTFIATYADDTAILSKGSTPRDASAPVQNHLLSYEGWLRKWRMKVNVEKSAQVTFTLRRSPTPGIYLSGRQIPQSTTVKYLGLLLDSRLTWKEHTRWKRLVLNQRLKIVFPLVGNRSPLKLKTKLLLYTSLLRPVWSYGTQIYGSAKASNLARLQRFQSKYLRLITGAPFYVSNMTLHSDLRLPFVKDYVKELYTSFHAKLGQHPNPRVAALHRRQFPLVRRLRRRWSRDLLA